MRGLIPRNAALERVIEAAGGQTALGRRLGLAQSTVRGWVIRNQVSREWASAVADVARTLEPPVIVSVAELAGLPNAEAA